LRRRKQQRRPAAAADKPALEQLPECLLAAARRSQQGEQRSLLRVGAEPDGEAGVAEQVKLNQDGLPLGGGERGERAGELARTRRAATADDSEDGSLALPLRPPARALLLAGRGGRLADRWADGGEEFGCGDGCGEDRVERQLA
jgi:hypothetical protein